jgi:hypothetical protein
MLDHGDGGIPHAGGGISGVDSGDTSDVRWIGEEEFGGSGVDDAVDAGDGATLAA